MKIVSKLVEAHVFRECDKGIEFLLLKRAENQPYPGIWQMVSGKIEKNEKAHETALREIKEETGLIAEKLWAVPNVNSFYEPIENCISMLPVFAAKICDKSQVRICSEHTEWKWVDPEQAKKMLAWVGQKLSVDIIIEYLSRSKNYLNFIEIKI